MTDLEAVIYGALMHHGKPCTIEDFERAARTVAEMLERRQSAAPAQQPEPEPEVDGWPLYSGLPPAPSPTVGERERFEAWCLENRYDLSSVDGQYCIGYTRHFWMAWQARAALAQPAAHAEPVAWRADVGGVMFHGASKDGLIQALKLKLDATPDVVQPLYLGPQSNPPAQKT